MVPEPDRVIAKRFRLIAELASGNMGSVWLADHLGLGVRCAVKVMAHAALLDPSGRARFELEARAVARLESRHIVRVLDYDVEDDTPFIAMELLRGEELTARIARLGRLEPAATYGLVSQIAQGLASAHAAGIVHRDLKPDNIFLAQTDEGEVVKILDFGIAKMVSQEWSCGTLAGETLGTPQFMSPEQVRGAKTIDHRADLWSLAVVTYGCLLGQLPFDGRAVGDVFAQIIVDPLPVPSRVAPPGVHVPPGFDAWWARAVSREVEGRFGSAKEMVEALGKALGELESEGSAADVTTPPVALSPGEALDEPVELPIRSQWRSKAALVAVAVGIAAVPMVGHLRTLRALAASATAPAIAPVALAPTAAPSVAAPQVLVPPPPEEERRQEAPPAPRVVHASVSHASVSHAIVLPVGRRPAVRTPVRPAPVVVVEPAPTPRPSAATAASTPPPPPPADDVDFGI